MHARGRLRISGFVSSLVALAVFATPILAAGPTKYPTLGEIVRIDPEFDQLIDKDAVIEVLASGFAWTEGPLWVKDGGKNKTGALLFSDIPNNRVMQWAPGNGGPQELSVYLQPSGYTGLSFEGREPGCNGLALDAKGQLISCEHGDRRISLLTPGGGKRTLVDNYQGKRLNSPNDVCVHASTGDIYFTDPIYGLPGGWNDKRRELDFCGVYRLHLNADGRHELSVVTKELTRPNGVAFSPDGKTLYVAQSEPAAAIWMKYPVAADGTTGEGQLFADATPMVKSHKGLPDGFKIDADGRMWTSGPGGIHVYSPAGKLLGRIDTFQATSNCAWGGDGSTLYITADMYLCRIQTKVKGVGWK